MKVALITGGQPRFTPDSVILLNQLKGIESADLYTCFWPTDWAQESETAKSKIKKILPANFNVVKADIVDLPQYELPPHTVELAEPEPENVHWWYKRGWAQSSSLSLAFDSIDQQYDAVIRFRLDTRLDRDIDLTQFDLINNNLIFPAGPNCGNPLIPMNDQFAIGTYDGMKTYCNLAKRYNEMVVMADPNWQNEPHGKWRGEWLLGAYMVHIGQPLVYGNFNVIMNGSGRSRFTDKHFHHPVAADPTEK
jgi:hypothetical protein